MKQAGTRAHFVFPKVVAIVAALFAGMLSPVADETWSPTEDLADHPALREQRLAGFPHYLYYAKSDNSVGSIDPNDLTGGAELGTALFYGGAVGAARNIAVDSIQRLLYYAATDGSVHSIFLDTLTDGPVLGPEVFIEDGGSNPGAGRKFALHVLLNQIFHAAPNGNVGIVQIGIGMGIAQRSRTSLSAALFEGGNVGANRQLTIDPWADLLYYSVTDGRVASIDLQTLEAGPSIPIASFVGGNPGAGRRIAYDVQTRVLWYSVSDGSVVGIDPSTSAAAETLSSTLFAGANPGADRNIAVESPLYLIYADGFESGNTSAWSSSV